MIELRPRDGQERRTWELLLDLAEEAGGEPWTLIGAQMVALHAWEANREEPRRSRDADLLVDARLAPRATEQLTRRLLDRGFELRPPDPIQPEIAHRLSRDGLLVDVLAPDGLGARTSMRTVPPLRTLAVPGGTQALRRTERAEVALDSREGVVPRPNLLGAILVKARAVEVSNAPEDQLSDLAFLLSLAGDPRALASELSGKERGWLRSRVELDDPRAPLWSGIENAEDAQLAYTILCG